MTALLFYVQLRCLDRMQLGLIPFVYPVVSLHSSVERREPDLHACRLDITVSNVGFAMKTECLTVKNAFNQLPFILEGLEGCYTLVP